MKGKKKRKLSLAFFSLSTSIPPKKASPFRWRFQRSNSLCEVRSSQSLSFVLKKGREYKNEQLPAGHGGGIRIASNR